MKRLTLLPIFPARGAVPPRLPRRARRVARRRPVDGSESVLDEPRDLREANASVQERRDRDLVRRVERAREGAAALSRLAREAEQRKALEIRRLELEREAGREVETAVARSPGAPGT